MPLPEIEFDTKTVLPDANGPALDTTGASGIPEVDFGGEGRGHKPFEPDYSKDPLIGHPTLYAVMRSALDFVPYARYTLPSERQALWHLSEGEMRQQLVGDLFWAELALAFYPTKALSGKSPAGALARLPFKLMKRSPSGLKLKPVQDLVLHKPFDYLAEAERTARKKLKFSKIESTGVAAFAAGDKRALFQAFWNTQQAGGKMSKAWSKWTKFVPGKGFELAAETLARLSPQEVKSKTLTRDFFKALKTAGLVGGKETKGLEYNWGLAAYRDLAKMYFPEEVAAKLNLSTASEKLVGNFIDELLGNSKARTVARQAITLRGQTGGIWPTSLTASQTVFGFGEGRFRTFSRIFRPIELGFRNSWNYTGDKIYLFSKMLEQRGLGQVIIKRTLPSGEHVFTFKPGPYLKKETLDEAGRLLTQFGDLLEAAKRAPKAQLAGMLQQARANIAQQLAQVRVANPALGDFIETHYQFMDHLYGDWFKWAVPRALENVGLTLHGQVRITTLVARLNPIVDKTLAASTSGNYVDTVGRLKKTLEFVQKIVRQGFDKDTVSHPWFQSEGEELAGKLLNLFDELSMPSMAKGGKFVEYIENYAPRLADKEFTPVAAKLDGLVQGRQAFFTKQRKLIESRQVLPYSDLLSARVQTQGKAMHLYPVLDKVADFAKRLPPTWQTYTEHFVRRALGLPSNLDDRVAELLTRSIGRLERIAGREGQWDAQRVNDLAYTVNDLIYMGALGFKPFSALRNLLQPLLTVPADLGGTKDLFTFAKGVHRGLSGPGREYLQRIGAITEYLPEIRSRTPVLPMGLKAGSIRLPTRDRIRDTSLWMFQGSDRFSRYVAGGSAMVKWEAALTKLGAPTRASFRSFERASGLIGRNSWIRAEIKDHLLTGRIEEAKKAFVLDVVADTQYLYGSIYRPGLLSELGAIGRTASAFQTWWMHYGSLLDKWLRTGASPGTKLERYFTWMLSSALAYEAAERLWGAASARRTVGFGPFPKGLTDVGTPPAWGVAEGGLKNIFGAGDILYGEDTSRAKQRALELLKAPIIMIPGGLAASDLIKGTSREGLAGFLKALGRFKAPEENRGPLTRGVRAVGKLLD